MKGLTSLQSQSLRHLVGEQGYLHVDPADLHCSLMLIALHSGQNCTKLGISSFHLECTRFSVSQCMCAKPNFGKRIVNADARDRSHRRKHQFDDLICPDRLLQTARNEGVYVIDDLSNRCLIFRHLSKPPRPAPQYDQSGRFGVVERDEARLLACEMEQACLLQRCCYLILHAPPSHHGRAQRDHTGEYRTKNGRAGVKPFPLLRIDSAVDGREKCGSNDHSENGRGYCDYSKSGCPRFHSTKVVRPTPVVERGRQ